MAGPNRPQDRVVAHPRKRGACLRREGPHEHHFSVAVSDKWPLSHGSAAPPAPARLRLRLNDPGRSKLVGRADGALGPLRVVRGPCVTAGGGVRRASGRGNGAASRRARHWRPAVVAAPDAQAGASCVPMRGAAGGPPMYARTPPRVTRRAGTLVRPALCEGSCPLTNGLSVLAIKALL